MVRPAKAPPRRTRPMATARYIQSLGCFGDIGGSASMTTSGDHLVGAARSKGSCAMPTRRSFATDRMAGRLVAYPGRDRVLDDAGVTC